MIYINFAPLYATLRHIAPYTLPVGIIFITKYVSLAFMNQFIAKDMQVNVI